MSFTVRSRGVREAKTYNGNWVNDLNLLSISVFVKNNNSDNHHKQQQQAWMFMQLYLKPKMMKCVNNCALLAFLKELVNKVKVWDINITSEKKIIICTTYYDYYIVTFNFCTLQVLLEPWVYLLCYQLPCLDQAWTIYKTKYKYIYKKYKLMVSIMVWYPFNKREKELYLVGRLCLGRAHLHNELCLQWGWPSHQGLHCYWPLLCSMHATDPPYLKIRMGMNYSSAKSMLMF